MEIDKLPSTIGVYLFFKNTDVLYVGKAVNIKARIKSHIENAKTDAKEAGIVNNATKIEYKICDSEFKALLLEAELIKNTSRNIM